MTVVWVNGMFPATDVPQALGFTDEALQALDNYQLWVLSKASVETVSTRGNQMAAGALGIAGEGGEIADIAKKLLFHGHPLTHEVARQVGLEIGDTLWYLALLTDAIGFKLSEVLTANIDKLEERYPEGRLTPKRSMARYEEERDVSSDYDGSAPPEQVEDRPPAPGAKRHRRRWPLISVPDRSEFPNGFTIPQVEHDKS